MGALASKFIYPAHAFDHGGKIMATPLQYDMNHEDIGLKAADGCRLKGYLLLQEGTGGAEVQAATRPALLYFHGNAGDMGDRLPMARVSYTQYKFNVFMLSYRGYGTSQGKPDEEGIRLDSQAALDFVLAHPLLAKTKIVVFGESLGAAVAIDVVHRNPDKVHCVVLENAFWSMHDVIRHLAPVAVPFLPLIGQKWESGKRIADFAPEFPVLFLSGRADQLIPPSHSNKLFAACPSKKKCFSGFPRGTHVDTCLQPGYEEAVKRFLQQHGFVDPDDREAFGMDRTVRELLQHQADLMQQVADDPNFDAALLH